MSMALSMLDCWYYLLWMWKVYFINMEMSVGKQNLTKLFFVTTIIWEEQTKTITLEEK